MYTLHTHALFEGSVALPAQGVPLHKCFLSPSHEFIVPFFDYSSKHLQAACSFMYKIPITNFR